MIIFNRLNIFSLSALCCLTLAGCTGTPVTLSSANLSASPTPSSTSGIPFGARAAKFIFLQASGGSFDAPPAAGTPASPGSGLQATRVFNPDGTSLATSTSSSSWPSWITSFEIGISGAANSSATNPNCANFSSGTESSDDNCDVNATGTKAKCGAASGIYRVSEVDCSIGAGTAAGNGGPSDGVYFRAVFNRDTRYLGSTENILVVIEYSASALNPAPSDPSACFTAGKFTPESCSDFVWQAFIKRSTTDVVQPFLMLIPPTFSSRLLTTTTASATPHNAGTGVAAKQFFLPIAADSKITVFQASRIKSNFTGSDAVAGTSAYNLKTYCTKAGPTLPGNSPLCAGVVIYSVTFYRI